MKFATLKTTAFALLSTACADMGVDPGAAGAEQELAEVDGAVVTPANLAVSFAAPAVVNAGALVTFPVGAQNIGGSVANAARVDVPIPTGYTPSALTGGCTWLSSARTVRCSFGNIPAGQARSGSYALQMPLAAGSLVQRATAFTTSYEPVTSNNASPWMTTAILGADLGVTIAGPASATGGGSASVTATVSNTGALAASNVRITLSLPSGAWPTAPGCQLVYGPARVVCSVGTIAQGGSLSRTITYALPYDMTALNVTASAVGATPEPAVTNGNNSAALTVPVAAPTPVAVTLSLPTPQAVMLTNCFGDPGDFGSFAACDPAWLQSGQITLLDGGVVDTGDPSVAGTWSQPNGPESLEMEFTDATTGDVLMSMDGFGVSSSCFEGVNWWPGETANRGAFQLCTVP